ncbi:MAG: class I SAM-dependent methyltransferase [Planctomycetota bacterium]
MPDYAAIYDRIIAEHPGYNAAEGSPGFAAVLQHRARLTTLRGRSLDVGCGVGFVVWLLQSPLFNFESFGCDVSAVAIENARARIGGDADRVRLIEVDGRLPFNDDAFDLVTCFDVLEHLDAADLPRLRDELQRVREPHGAILLTVSLRAAASDDHEGHNLHRTVKPVQWWIDLFRPDETTIDHHLEQATMWFAPRAS